MTFSISIMDLVKAQSCKFETGIYQFVDGRYVFESYLPLGRSFCCYGRADVERLRFHRHGYFERGLTTIIKGRLSKVTILNLRWQCPFCDATFSIPPPNVCYRQRICIFIVFWLAWFYLNATGGIDSCYPPELDSLRERTQLLNYHKRLRETSQITQQSIKEAILDRVGPEDYELLFLTGLSPPESHQKCKDQHSFQVWGSLHLLEVSSRFLKTPLSTLLSRARELATINGRPFLTDTEIR